jgi:hypothetical protein
MADAGTLLRLAYRAALCGEEHRTKTPKKPAETFPPIQGGMGKVVCFD